MTFSRVGNYVSGTLHTKGQLISKWFLGSSISSKKRTNKFDFTTMIPQVDLFSFVFWRKSTTSKNLFEINWPLRPPSKKYILIRHFSSVNCIVYLSVYKSFRQALFTFKRLSNSSEYPMEISCSRVEENAPGGSRYVYYNCKYPKTSYTFLSNKSLISVIISWLIGWQVLPDQLAAVIWSLWKPTLPNIRILFDSYDKTIKPML